MSRAAAATLGLAAAGLLGLLVVEDRMLQGLPPVADPRTPSGAATAVAAQIQPDRTGPDVATILARPLFRPDRRPPATPGAASSRAADLPRLTAILIDGRGRRAIFAATGRPVVAAEGERVGVWLVQAIVPGEVTVYGPEGPRTLRPSYDPGAPGPSQPGLPQPGLPQPGLPATMAPAGPPAAPPAGASILDLLLKRGTPDIGVPGLPAAPATPQGPPLQGVPP